MRIETALAAFALLGLAAPTRAADEITVASPDGRVQFRLSKDGKGGLAYTVTLGSKSLRRWRMGEKLSHSAESREPRAPITMVWRMPMDCAMAPPANAPSGSAPQKSRWAAELTRPNRRSGVIAWRKLVSLIL